MVVMSAPVRLGEPATLSRLLAGRAGAIASAAEFAA